MHLVILGDGGLGSAVDDAARIAGLSTSVRGRPANGAHPAVDLRRADVVVEASRADAVVPNLRAALDAGCRRIVIATTGWSADRPVVAAMLAEFDASAVASANFSFGVALFGRLVDTAVELFGSAPGFDPYVVEWHRRTKRDRPSGTATDLAQRIVRRHPTKQRISGGPGGDGPSGPDVLEVASIRAGASPGMHLVGFDAPGETVELRLTARDRSTYAAGILAAVDWLMRAPRSAGLHPFDVIVDELVGSRVAA